jgi:hypothetical protein
MDALAVADPLDLFFSRRACTCSCGSPLRLVLREDRQGERFAQALAAKDDAAFCALVDRLDFQALTPGCHWQADTSRLCLRTPGSLSSDRARWGDTSRAVGVSSGRIATASCSAGTATQSVTSAMSPVRLGNRRLAACRLPDRRPKPLACTA